MMDWSKLPKPESKGGFFKWKELENGVGNDMKLLKVKVVEGKDVPWPTEDQHVKMMIEWKGKEYTQFVGIASQIARGLQDNNIQEGDDFIVTRSQAAIELKNGQYADGYAISKDVTEPAPKAEETDEEEVNIDDIPF